LAAKAPPDPPPAFLFAYRGLKSVAIAIGFVVTVIGVMSLMNLVTGNGWVQVVVALVVAIAVPAFIADRFLPHDDEVRVPGLVSDVFALVLFGLALLFVVVARPLLVKEADRFSAAGSRTLARLTFFFAGVHAEEAPAATPSASPSASGSGSSSASLAPLPSGSAPVAPGHHPERTAAELFKEWAPSVVSIKVKLAAGTGGGTGFAVDDAGTIATNHHVIAGASDVRVKLLSGKWLENVELLTEDTQQDLALLKIDLQGEALKAVYLGDSGYVTVGERAVSIGNPLGLEHTLTDGLVSSRRMIEGRAFIQMSVPVSPGNSGGPLFNMRGEVIGVTVAQFTGGMFGGAQNLNLAVPVNALRGLITGNYPKRHKFGGKDDAPGTW
jgi:serine protease Do